MANGVAAYFKAADERAAGSKISPQLGRLARTTLLAVLAASVSPIATARASDWNLYDGAGSSSFLTYWFGHSVNDPSTGKPHTVYSAAPSLEQKIQSSPALQVAVGDARPSMFTMDTGSTGIVMLASDIPGYDGMQKLGPGTLNYSSSGVQNSGYYVKLPVTVTGSNGAKITAEVPVLAVTDRSCAQNARFCDEAKLTGHIYMMGVGFGRETDSQAQGTPDKNPFLNLVVPGTSQPDGTVRPGYVVTRNGVYVGLTTQNTAGEFTYVKLGYDPAYRDWSGAPACIAVNGGTPTCGQSLVDTGISGQMYLRVPTSQLADSGTTAPAGTAFTILLPGNDPHQPLPQASYTFTVGDPANPLGPGEVIRPHYVTPFVNTSALFLNGFDYLYDYTNGFVGYRQNAVPGAQTSVTPVLSLSGPVALPDGFATSFPTVVSGGTTLVTSGSILLSGAVSGRGGLTIGSTGPLAGLGPQTNLVGSGTVTLSGHNTYTGGTQVLNGSTLAISADRNLGAASGGLTLAGGTLRTTAALETARTVTLSDYGIIDTRAPTAFTGTLTGNGGLLKTGSSSLTLSGTATYTGATLVSSGALTVNTDLTSSPIIVMSGATLNGHGHLGDVAVMEGGRLAPGNSIGTIRVGGNLNYHAGSSHEVEVDAAGQADRTEVAGQASLAGTLTVLAQAGTYAPRTRYTILTAAGGVTGQFADVTTNYAFLIPSLTYAANAVDLTVTRNDIAFSSVAQNRNQAAVADAIQAGGAGTALFGRTVGLTSGEAQGAFQALSGDVHASTVSTAYATAFFVREAILDRLRWDRAAGNTDGLNGGTVPAAYMADAPVQIAPVVSVPARVLDPQVFGLWGQGFGIFGNARSDGNAAGFSRQISGFALGADMRLESGIKLGLVGGYTYASFDTSGRLQSGVIESGYGGLYGGYEVGPVALRLGAVYSDNNISTRRSVTFAGFSDTATAHSGGSTIQGFAEIGYRIDLGRSGSAPLAAANAPRQVALSYIEPFVGGSYVSIERDRFMEGGLAGLTSFARDYDVGAVTTGLRGQTSVALDFGAPVSAHGLIGYRHAFGDVVPTALLASGNSPSFLTAGIPIDRDAVVAAAGLDLRVAARATVGVAYTGQAGSRAVDHAVKGNFTYRF